MPMLIPNHQSISKSIESISKTGIDIDAVVRNSLSKLSKTHHGVGYMTSSNNNKTTSTESTPTATGGSHLKTTTSTPAISGGSMLASDVSKKSKNNKINSSINGSKAMPLATRNKNSIDSLSPAVGKVNMSLSHHRKLSKTSLLRAKVCYKNVLVSPLPFSTSLYLFSVFLTSIPSLLRAIY